MKVVDFIKANRGDVNVVNTAYGIKVKQYDNGFSPNLFVLNYDQIESPKMEPIVKECRGLILDESLNIICRPFDRFFNLGEADTDKLDLSDFVFAPKLDGSLIKVYHWYGCWRIATRGTAFAESNVGDWGITFQDLALSALGFKTISEFDDWCMNTVQMNVGQTYLFELTAPENRVVTPYSDRKMTLLAIRNTGTGEYVQPSDLERENLNINNVVGYTASEIVQKANELKNLEEGFIGYNRNGVPEIKVKSAAYVAVHHIRGEGLNEKRSCELVLSGEVEEYLTYFPEDAKILDKYIKGWALAQKTIHAVYEYFKHIEDQKEFALAIANSSQKGVMFTARKLGISTTEALARATISSKVDIVKMFAAIYDKE